MPDLRGLTAREAVRALDAVGLSMRMTGAGVVTSQSPEPGDAIEAGAVTTVQFGRAPVTSETHVSTGGGTTPDGRVAAGGGR